MKQNKVSTSLAKKRVTAIACLSIFALLCVGSMSGCTSDKKSSLKSNDRVPVEVKGERITNTTTSTTTTTTLAPTTTLPPVTATVRRVVVTTRPVVRTSPPATAAPATQPQGSGCNPNYSPCVPNASDVDCAGGSGNGPVYVTGPIQVIGTDVYGLDSDHDGIGCE